MIIDRKFKIMAVNPCKMHTIYDETNSVLLCAHDAAVPVALRAYREECIRLGTNPEHIESITLLIGRIETYQVEVKGSIPDTETDCEIDRCIGGIGLSD